MSKNAFQMISPEKREMLLYVFAAISMVMLVALFYGMVWFNANPDDMNEPFVPAEYQKITVFCMVLVGAGLLISLYVNKKDYVEVRVFGTAVAFTLAAASYTWWFQVLPYLFG